MKRVLVIDSLNRTVTEKQVETLEDMQEIVGGLIERAGSFETGEDVYCNEEGLFVGYTTGFRIRRVTFSPILGNGFVIGGPDDRGDSTDCNMSVAEVKNQIEWLTVEEEA